MFKDDDATGDHGMLRIAIWVNWQGIQKRVTVLNVPCYRDKQREAAREFFEKNPCCAQLEPEITWTLTEHLPRAYELLCTPLKAAP